MNQTQLIDQWLASRPPGWLQQDRSPELIAAAVTFMVLEVLAFSLRTFARYLNRIRFERCDVLMILSLASNLAVGGGAILITRFGAGRHFWAISDSDWHNFSYTADYGLTCAYLLAVTFPKLALLDLYLHIFVSSKARYASYATAAVLIVNVLVNLPVILTQCHPFAAAWDPSLGECIDTAAYRALASLPNIATDLVMAVLPISTIYALQVPKHVKLSISISFLVGSLGLITAVVRFLQFFEFESVEGTFAYEDQTWLATSILIWTVVEPGVYHLTACSVSFRPLAAWLTGRRPFEVLASARDRPAHSADTSEAQRQHSERRMTPEWPGHRGQMPGKDGSQKTIQVVSIYGISKV